MLATSKQLADLPEHSGGDALRGAVRRDGPRGRVGGGGRTRQPNRPCWRSRCGRRWRSCGRRASRLGPGWIGTPPTRGSTANGICGSSSTPKAPGTCTPAARSMTAPGSGPGSQPVIDARVQGQRARRRARAARGVRVRRAHRTRPPPRPARAEASKPATQRSMAIIRVDHAALRARDRSKATRSATSPASAPSPCASPATCSATSILKLVITKGVDVMNVTHLGRRATVAATSRTVVATTRAARLEGCTRTFRLENDHRDDWAEHPPHAPRRTRPALRAPPRPQDLPRMGTRRRQRTHDPWSHPTTPATPRTDHHLTAQ